MIKTQLNQPAWQVKLGNLINDLNGSGHKLALQIFMAIVLAHFAEHIVQVYQIYVLHWAIPESRGILGLWFPWLVTSELLHYGYAIIMLFGLFILRPGFVGRSRLWWDIALVIQFWHHIEHALLQGQAIVGQNLFNYPIPMSVVQFWISRVELHFLYNTLVFVPMVISMYYHLCPPAGEEAHATCACSTNLALRNQNQPAT